MPAPNLETLFAYEAAIEPAWKIILTNLGLNAFVEFSDENKATPYVDIQLTDVVPASHLHLIGQIGYYDAWKGSLISRVVTQRGKNSDQQAAILGAIRNASQSLAGFTTGVVPYHRVDNLKESGLTRGVIEDQNLDASELRLAIQFSIRTDAWP